MEYDLKKNYSPLSSDVILLKCSGIKIHLKLSVTADIRRSAKMDGEPAIGMKFSFSKPQKYIFGKARNSHIKGETKS